MTREEAIKVLDKELVAALWINHRSEKAVKEAVEVLKAPVWVDTSCDGCRYGYFGNAVCDRCSRMYMDRYEREENKDAAD